MICEQIEINNAWSYTMSMKRKAVLTTRQELFAQEYLFDTNATNAALRAGYSKKTSKVASKCLYGHPRVRARIDELMKERSRRVKIDADYVLTRMGEIDQLDIIDILDNEGNLLPIQNWPKIWRISISGIDLTKVGKGDDIEVIKKIKWPDKVKNLEMIGRHIVVSAFKTKEEEDSKSRELPPIKIIFPSNGR